MAKKKETYDIAFVKAKSGTQDLTGVNVISKKAKKALANDNINYKYFEVRNNEAIKLVTWAITHKFLIDGAPEGGLKISPKVLSPEERKNITVFNAEI